MRARLRAWRWRLLLNSSAVAKQSRVHEPDKNTRCLLLLWCKVDSHLSFKNSPRHRGWFPWWHRCRCRGPSPAGPSSVVPAESDRGNAVRGTDRPASWLSLTRGKASETYGQRERGEGAKRWRRRTSASTVLWQLHNRLTQSMQKQGMSHS